MSEYTQGHGFWKTAFLYGAPAGFLIISLMIAGFVFFGFQSGASSMAVGFLIMFFILSLIYLGIMRFRDREQGGFIKFSKALFLGMAMSLFAGLVYVLVWEIYTAVTGNSFIAFYTDHLIELEQAKGVSGDALSEFVDKMESTKASYANPFYRMPVTFSEIFPMGFIVSLVSAFALHNPKFWARS